MTASSVTDSVGSHAGLQQLCILFVEALSDFSMLCRLPGSPVIFPNVRPLLKSLPGCDRAQLGRTQAEMFPLVCR